MDLNWVVPTWKWIAALHRQEPGERDFYREKEEAKQGNYLVGYSLRVCLI